MIPSGLSQDIPGPFFCYYTGLGCDQVKDACELIELVIEEEGPFVGFIGFSQGASVGMSYLMNQEIKHPDSPLPFKWAVCFASTIAISPDRSFLEKELSEYDAEEGAPSILGPGNTGDAVSVPVKLPKNRVALLKPSNRRLFAQEMAGLIRLSINVAIDLGVEAGVDMAGIEEDLQKGRKSSLDCPRLYHPLILAERIQIPTVHCIGLRDHPDIVKQAQVVSGLCAEEQCIWLEHSGGHDIPRDPHELAAVVGATKRAIEQSQWLAPRL